MNPRPRWPARFKVAPAKIFFYLLNPSHADGGPKCAILAQFGLTPQTPGKLYRALHAHASLKNFRNFVPAPGAFKMYFEGELDTPTLPGPNVRTVWQVDDDDATRTARFVTLKPLRRLPTGASDF